MALRLEKALPGRGLLESPQLSVHSREGVKQRLGSDSALRARFPFPHTILPFEVGIPWPPFLESEILPEFWGKGGEKLTVQPMAKSPCSTPELTGA